MKQTNKQSQLQSKNQRNKTKKQEKADIQNNEISQKQLEQRFGKYLKVQEQTLDKLKTCSKQVEQLINNTATSLFQLQKQIMTELEINYISLYEERKSQIIDYRQKLTERRKNQNFDIGQLSQVLTDQGIKQIEHTLNQQVTLLTKQFMAYFKSKVTQISQSLTQMATKLNQQQQNQEESASILQSQKSIYDSIDEGLQMSIISQISKIVKKQQQNDPEQSQFCFGEQNYPNTQYQISSIISFDQGYPNVKKNKNKPSLIADLPQIYQQNVRSKFKLRAKIVKILYFKKQQDKQYLKLIVGDSSGLAVLTLPYDKHIKTGNQLQLFNCISLQLFCSEPTTIQSHLAQVQVTNNTYILGEHLVQINNQWHYNIVYNMVQKEWSLARNLAFQLKLGDSSNVKNMVVKVTKIIYEQKENKIVFGQVADSSGIIYAYLRKHPVKVIKLNDVLWLKKCKILHHYQKKGTIDVPILFIDISEEGTVQKFYHQFWPNSQLVIEPYVKK